MLQEFKHTVVREGHRDKVRFYFLLIKYRGLSKLLSLSVWQRFREAKQLMQRSRMIKDGER